VDPNEIAAIALTSALFLQGYARVRQEETSAAGSRL
jgi:hypothetical protein